MGFECKHRIPNTEHRIPNTGGGQTHGTCNGDGVIELITAEGISSGLMQVTSTFRDADTLAWRQWHHWNKMDPIGSVDLKEGVQVITLKTVSNGNYELRLPRV